MNKYMINNKNQQITQIQPTESNFTKSKIFLILCAFGFFASLGVKIFVSNQYAVKGFELTQLMDKQNTLQKDIYALELKISQLSSLAYVEEKAEKMGFVSGATQMVYFRGPSFALNRQ